MPDPAGHVVIPEGDPAFRASHPPTVTVFRAFGADAANVEPGIGFKDTNPRGPFACGKLGQPFRRKVLI